MHLDNLVVMQSYVVFNDFDKFLDFASRSRCRALSAFVVLLALECMLDSFILLCDCFSFAIPHGFCVARRNRAEALAASVVMARNTAAAHCGARANQSLV